MSTISFDLAQRSDQSRKLAPVNGPSSCSFGPLHCRQKNYDHLLLDRHAARPTRLTFATARRRSLGLLLPWLSLYRQLHFTVSPGDSD